MTDVVQTPSIEIVASVDVETVFGSESVTTVIETEQRPDVIVVTQAADVIATAQPHTVVEAETDTVVIESAKQGPPGVDGVGSYTNASPTPTAVGGIPSGSVFSNRTMTDMFDALLYPYQAPTFSAFGISSQAAVLEVGDSVLSNRTYTWSISNSSNVGASPLTLTAIDGQVFAPASALGTLTPTTAAVRLTAPGSRSASISGQNTQAATFSRTTTVEWRWRRFFGSSSNAAVTDPVPVGGASLSTSSAGTYAYSAAAGTYKYIIVPTSSPTLSTFKDQSTNLDVPFEAAYTASVTNGFGEAVTYRFYRSTNQLGGAITIVAS